MSFRLSRKIQMKKRKENGAETVPCPSILNPQGPMTGLPGLPVLFQWGQALPG
jgi:hypothetical protein